MHRETLCLSTCDVSLCIMCVESREFDASLRVHLVLESVTNDKDAFGGGEARNPLKCWLYTLA